MWNTSVLFGAMSWSVLWGQLSLCVEVLSTI